MQSQAINCFYKACLCGSFSAIAAYFFSRLEWLATHTHFPP
jgi:hypothetical protein